MPTLFQVQHVATAARDRHALFSPERHPDPVLLRAISEYHQLLSSRVIEIDPTLIVADADIELPLADFDAGAELPVHDYLARGTVRADECEWPLTFTTAAARFDPPAWPAAYVEAGRVHLCGKAPSWAWYDRITVSYAGVPVALTRLSDRFALPDSSFPALAARLALFMATRDPDFPAATKADLAREWADAEAAFLTGVAGRARAVTMQIRDVW